MAHTQDAQERGSFVGYDYLRYISMGVNDELDKRFEYMDPKTRFGINVVVGFCQRYALDSTALDINLETELIGQPNVIRRGW